MDYANEFPVKMMSKLFKVSRSGYYRWLKRKDSYREKTTFVDEQIKEAFKKSKSNYGSPRICAALEKEGVYLSKSTVARRMKALKISPKRKRRFKQTTDSNHNLGVSPNLLEQRFKVNEIGGLGQVWVSDITYIRLRYSFVYLTTVIDLANRMVVGWNLSKYMTDQQTSIAALKNALEKHRINRDLIFHSDRGVQYASNDFRKLLNENNCIQSMSRKGNCYDNAVAESFFKTIKVEALYKYKFESIEQVESVIFDYIDGWYNTKRIHSALGNQSPSEVSKSLNLLRA